MKATAVLTCAVYVRVSTQDQKLSQQLRGMREEAGRRGWRIVAVFRERESTRKERPQLGRMLDAAMLRKFGAVMVWRLDRLGRSLVELVSNVERLNGRGVHALSVKDGALDTSSASAKFQLTILAAVAEYERELIRERTREGLARVKRRGSESGRPIGRPPADVDKLNAAAAWLASEQTDLVDRVEGKRRSVREAARRHGIGLATLSRFLERSKKGGPKNGAGPDDGTGPA